MILNLHSINIFILTDVIGSVIGIGDIVHVMSAAGKKIRRTVVVEDSE